MAKLEHERRGINGNPSVLTTVRWTRRCVMDVEEEDGITWAAQTGRVGVAGSAEVQGCGGAGYERNLARVEQNRGS